MLAYGEYDPFGNPVATYGAESAFGYTGKQEDESGLLFLRARYYDAGTGHFLSQDTWKGETTRPQTQHLYNYVIGNPVNYVDPTGHYIDLGVGSNAPRNMHDFSTGHHVSYNDNYTWKENDPRCQSNQYCEAEAVVSVGAAFVAPVAAEYAILQGGGVYASQWLMANTTVYGNALVAQFPWMAQAGAGLWGLSNTVDDAATLYAGATGDYNAVASISAMSNIDGGYLPFGDAIAGVQYFGRKLTNTCSDFFARSSQPAFINNYVDDYVPTSPRETFGQETVNSCVAGSCRMYLTDFLSLDQIRPEAYYRTPLNIVETGPNAGGLISDIVTVANHYGIPSVYVNDMSIDGLRSYLQNGPAVVTVKNDTTVGYHAVVVDSIENGLVAVRDPAPQGRGIGYWVRLDFNLHGAGER